MQHFTGKAGDVVIANFLTAHNIAPNRSPNIRYAVYFRVHTALCGAGEFWKRYRPVALALPWHDWSGLGCPYSCKARQRGWGQDRCECLQEAESLCSSSGSSSNPSGRDDSDHDLKKNEQSRRLSVHGDGIGALAVIIQCGQVTVGSWPHNAITESSPKKIKVHFHKTFNTPPTIGLALNLLDVQAGANTRIVASESSVTTAGFLLTVSTWGDSKNWKVGVTWWAVVGSNEEKNNIILTGTLAKNGWPDKPLKPSRPWKQDLMSLVKSSKERATAAANAAAPATFLAGLSTIDATCSVDLDFDTKIGLKKSFFFGVKSSTDMVVSCSTRHHLWGATIRWLIIPNDPQLVDAQAGTVILAKGEKGDHAKEKKKGGSVFSQNVTFPRPFRCLPHVVVMISGLHTDRHRNTRARAFVTHVSRSECVVNLESWHDSITTHAKVSWLAVGQQIVGASAKAAAAAVQGKVEDEGKRGRASGSSIIAAEDCQRRLKEEVNGMRMDTDAAISMFPKLERDTVAAVVVANDGDPDRIVAELLALSSNG